MMLYKLLSAANQSIVPYVVVLENIGKIGPMIKSLGIPVYPIGMKKREFPVRSAIGLYKLIGEIQPDLIQAWTYHSNVATSLISAFYPHIPVVWNIRHTPYNLQDYGKLTYLIIRYGAWLSRQPVYTIYNSHFSIQKHRELGYFIERYRVIPNGFDTDNFKPSAPAYEKLRRDLDLPHDSLIIGMVNRYHPMKDHANFLQAASQTHKTCSEVNFVLVGRGVDRSNPELVSQIQNLNLMGKVFLLGERTDIANVTAGFDIASMTSAWGDAFPNVVGEAMSCGVPCVVTDIGDSARIVGDTGIVVPPKNSEALANAWRELITLGPMRRKQLGLEARNRIEEYYALPSIVRKYESLYQEILG